MQLKDAGEVAKRFIAGSFLMIIGLIVGFLTCIFTLGLEIPPTFWQWTMIGGGAFIGLVLGAAVPPVSGAIFSVLMRMFEG